MAMDDLIGRHLGKYELRSEIGRGGMGVVYEGYDPMLERRVAVKVLAPHLVWEQEFVERFLREARAAARLKHPNIVTIHDVGHELGWYFFVMEYLEGRPLTALIRERGPMPFDDVLAMLRPLARALDYAHECGVVHRDVKPANAILGPRGQIALTDFGIAGAGQTTRLTHSGVVIGTPEYMSPEQAQGHPVDACSDQYALGVIAYELLSGHPPFEAESTPALLYKAVHEPLPPLSQARPDLPAEAVQALEQTLAKEPGQRHASCAAFVEAMAVAAEAASWPRKEAAAGAPPSIVAPVPSGPTGPPDASGGMRRPSVAPDRTRSILRLALAIGGLGVVALVVWIAANATGDSAKGAPTEVSQPTAISPMPPMPPADAVLGHGWIHPVTGMAMVYVPAGEFEMGSSDGDPDERPVHTVVLDGFWIDRTEVTVAQFRDFVNGSGHETAAEQDGTGWVADESTGQWVEITGADWEHPHGPASQAEADHPVVQVTWADASAYCAWHGGALPTEAQWEYAARGPEGRRYPWGNTFDGARLNSCDANCPLPWKNADTDDGYRYTAPVGNYPDGASWCGALDLAGNEWEWVANWYGPYTSGQQRNPTGPATGDKRCERGRCCGDSDGERQIRGADRLEVAPDSRDHTLGFRCVVSPGQ